MEIVERGTAGRPLAGGRLAVEGTPGLTPYAVVESPAIRLYHADCLEGMRQVLGEGTVSVVVTSPPYNIGTRYNVYQDSQPREEYLAWIEQVGLEVRRVLEPGGSFFLNVGSRPSDPWIAWDVAQRLRQHFSLQNVIHWVKSIAILQQDAGHYPNIVGDVAVGHYKPIGGSRYLNDCHEYIFHFTRSGTVKLDRLAIGVPYQDKSNVGRWKQATRDLRCRGNTWFIPYQTIRDRATQRPHPSTFPVALPEMCLRLHGVDKVTLALDPFMGIGSTALACLKLGLPCVGFDIDSTYLDTARERLSQGALAPRRWPRDGQGEVALG